MADEISRAVKTSSGTTEYASDTDILPDEVNTDHNTVYSKINGNIKNGNIAAGTGTSRVELSKLAPSQASEAVATRTNQQKETNPGRSGASTVAVDLDDELEHLRYMVHARGVGIGTLRNGTTAPATTTGWHDLPAVGPNLLRNSSFEGTENSSGVPDGWTVFGSTPTVATTTADGNDGDGPGRAVQITASGSTDQGLTQTLAGLKEATYYLIGARCQVNSGDTATLRTTGASSGSEFDDLELEVTSTTSVWVSGVVLTDTTPTDIVVHLLSTADTDVSRWDHAFVRECSLVPFDSRQSVVTQQIAATAGTPITGSTTSSGLDTNFQFVDDGTDNLDKTVYVPGPGYYIKVTAMIQAAEVSSVSGDQVFIGRVYEDIDGAGLTAGGFITGRASSSEGSVANIGEYNIHLTKMVLDPTPGSSYRYAAAASKTSGANVTPQKGGLAHSLLVIEVLPYG